MEWCLSIPGVCLTEFSYGAGRGNQLHGDALHSGIGTGSIPLSDHGVCFIGAHRMVGVVINGKTAAGYPVTA